MLMNQAKIVVIWFRMLNLEIEFINGLKITSGFGDCSDEDWRDCHDNAAKSSHIGNQFSYDLLFYSTKHVGSRPKIKLMQSVIQFKF